MWFAYPGFAYPMFVSLTMKEIWKLGNEKWFVYPMWFAYPGFAYPMFVSLTMKEIWKLVLGNEKWFAYPMCSLIRGSLIQHRLYIEREGKYVKDCSCCQKVIFESNILFL